MSQKTKKRTSLVEHEHRCCLAAAGHAGLSMEGVIKVPMENRRKNSMLVF